MLELPPEAPRKLRVSKSFACSRKVHSNVPALQNPSLLSLSQERVPLFNLESWDKAGRRRFERTRLEFPRVDPDPL